MHNHTVTEKLMTFLRLVLVFDNKTILLNFKLVKSVKILWYWGSYFCYEGTLTELHCDETEIYKKTQQFNSLLCRKSLKTKYTGSKLEPDMVELLTLCLQAIYSIGIPNMAFENLKLLKIFKFHPQKPEVILHL